MVLCLSEENAISNSRNFFIQTFENFVDAITQHKILVLSINYLKNWPSNCYSNIRSVFGIALVVSHNFCIKHGPRRRFWKSWIAQATGQITIQYQWITIRETSCATHWIEIYPIHLSNTNWNQVTYLQTAKGLTQKLPS